VLNGVDVGGHLVFIFAFAGSTRTATFSAKSPSFTMGQLRLSLLILLI